MKILHLVEFYDPSVGGAQEVVKQLSERMAALGHEVTVATTKLEDRQSNIINGVNIVEFDISGNQVRGYHGDTNAYKKFLLNNTFDVIMNYAAQQWTADLFFEVMDKVSAKKVFVPCGFSGLFDPRYTSYFAAMPAILKQYDATIFLSNDYQDITFARKHGVKNIHIIPNGVNEKEFINPPPLGIRKKLGISPDDFVFLTVGSHTNQKGHKESIELFKRLNMPHSRLVIVGNEVKNGCKSRCSLSGLLSFGKIIVPRLTRSETVQLFFESNLFLFLSNIECSPLVVFEAAAAGLPVATVEVGNTKEITSWLQCGVILKTSKNDLGYSCIQYKSAIEQIREMMKNKADLVDMGKHARAKCLDAYTWDAITDKYVELYASL